MEIVLEAKNLEPYEVSVFEKDKTPKALDNQVESICKLACKDAHADCSASLCLRQRNAKRHLEKGDARGEYFTGDFSAFYCPIFSFILRYRWIFSKDLKTVCRQARGFAFEPKADGSVAQRGEAKIFAVRRIPHSLRQEKPQLNYQLRFLVYSPIGEFYCFAVILLCSDIAFGS